VEEKLDVYVKYIAIIQYDGVKSMLRIQFLIRLKLDIFGQVWILERAILVFGLTVKLKSEL
jgi:hypothetical protein